VNVTAAGGLDRWREAGEPLIPSLVVDGVATPILHRSQLASLLGLPVASSGDAQRVAGDTISILDSWATVIEPVDWESLIAPTPSRGRTIRNLTVNVFHPFELLPTAWADGRFEWDPDRDDEREAQIETAEGLQRYASAISQAWTATLLEVDPTLAGDDRHVDSPRGEISFSNLLEQQRWHAAFHYRQITTFLTSRGQDVKPLDLTGFAGLDLPEDVF
jgi:hypothetical protein